MKVLIAPRRREKGEKGEKSQNPQKGIQSIVDVDDESLIITKGEKKKKKRSEGEKELNFRKIKMGKCRSEKA